MRAEFTFENSGNNYQYQDVGNYLSTNSYISKYDRLIRSRNIGLLPDEVYPSVYEITIPSDTTCNMPYWIGVKIDKNDSLTEFHEFNNASYIPVQVGWDWSCLVFTLNAKLTVQPFALP